MDAIAWMLNPPKAASAGAARVHRIEVEEDTKPFGAREIAPAVAAPARIRPPAPIVHDPAVHEPGQWRSREARLKALLTYLEQTELVTCEMLAPHFGRSMRTVYRDIDDLRERGHRIDGSRGLGFMFRKKVG